MAKRKKTPAPKPLPEGEVKEPFWKKKHKFRAKRFVYNGRNYPSTAQAERAMELDGLQEVGDIRFYLEEVKIPLGPDFSARVDFLVFGPASEWAEDVKGMETPRFRTIRRLWAKYGPLPLHVLKKGKKTEIINGRK